MSMSGEWPSRSATARSSPTSRAPRTVCVLQCGEVRWERLVGRRTAAINAPCAPPGDADLVAPSRGGEGAGIERTWQRTALSGAGRTCQPGRGADRVMLALADPGAARQVNGSDDVERSYVLRGA